jgi:hypothetical protein
MASVNGAPSTTVLVQVKQRAGWLLVCLSILSHVTLASLVLGEHNPVTEGLMLLLMVVLGNVLGIMWCTRAVSRESLGDPHGPPQ